MSLIKFNDYLNESKSEMNILDAITFVLKEEDRPLSMLEIWSKISELNLLSKLEFDRINNAIKDGKVVGVYSGYLDTLLSRSSVNTKRSDSNRKNLFEIVGSRPNMKYKLVSENEIKDKYIETKMTFIEAAQLILKQNNNTPMSAREIWDEIEEQDLVETSGATPWATLNAQMLSYSDNTNISRKKKNKIFHIVSDNPAMFILINPELEVQSVPDEDEILSPSDFIKTPEKSKDYVKNEFMQAICVLGSPAAGKSVTSLNVLENSDHESLLVIPTDLSTSMIAQFLFGKLKLNKLGRFLLEAYKNPDKLYTVVIDEFHKPLTIKRVNDELLQAISLQRYNETRFLVGDVADELFLEHLENIPGLLRKDYMFHGNIKIPSNFGFILISSKPNIVVDNGDIYDRVDIVYLERSDIGKINTISDLLSRKIHTIEDKKSFKQMIKSKEDE